MEVRADAEHAAGPASATHCNGAAELRDVTTASSPHCGFLLESCKIERDCAYGKVATTAVFFFCICCIAIVGEWRRSALGRFADNASIRSKRAFFGDSYVSSACQIHAVVRSGAFLIRVIFS